MIAIWEGYSPASTCRPEMSIVTTTRRVLGSTHELLRPSLYHRSFVFVAPAPFISVAFEAFVVLAPSRVEEDDRVSNDLFNGLFVPCLSKCPRIRQIGE